MNFAMCSGNINDVVDMRQYHRPLENKTEEIEVLTAAQIQDHLHLSPLNAKMTLDLIQAEIEHYDSTKDKGGEFYNKQIKIDKKILYYYTKLMNSLKEDGYASISLTLSSSNEHDVEKILAMLFKIFINLGFHPNTFYTLKENEATTAAQESEKLYKIIFSVCV